MSRNLSSQFVTAITSNGVAPIVLIRAYFDSGEIDLWNGVGNLVYSGITYTGVVPILNIDTVHEQKQIAATGFNLTLSGLDSTILSLAENEPYQGRPLEMYLALLDSSGAVISSPYMMFKGYMDTMTINDDGKTISITIAVENELIALERALSTSYTPESQKVNYPNDTFFNFVADIQNKTAHWG
jgi:hypothetical protein